MKFMRNLIFKLVVDFEGMVYRSVNNALPIICMFQSKSERHYYVVINTRPHRIINNIEFQSPSCTPIQIGDKHPVHNTIYVVLVCNMH